MRKKSSGAIFTNEVHVRKPNITPPRPFGPIAPQRFTDKTDETYYTQITDITNKINKLRLGAQTQLVARPNVDQISMLAALGWNPGHESKVKFEVARKSSMKRERAQTKKHKKDKHNVTTPL